MNDNTLLHRIRYWSAVLGVLALGLLFVHPLHAAVELVSLRIFSLSDRVRIEWETGQEYNTAAFQIFCKRETEPDSEFHPLGLPVPAQGSLDRGATYFQEFSNLEPGVSYCFRLQEITTDEEPGEVFEVCGYGIGVTPTPTATLTPTATPTFTATPAPTATPTFTAMPTTPPPTPTPTATIQGAHEVDGGVVIVVDTTTPTPEPTLIFVTVTPTPTPVFVPPTPTPLPTATPETAIAFFDLGGPRAQGGGSFLGFGAVADVLVLLLCLGGLGIGLLGVLALIGSIFYLRARDEDGYRRRPWPRPPRRY